MKRTNKDFRLSKSDKTMLALMDKQSRRIEMKHFMIEAQVAYNKAKAARFKENVKGDEE